MTATVPDVDLEELLEQCVPRNRCNTCGKISELDLCANCIAVEEMIRDLCN